MNSRIKKISVFAALALLFIGCAFGNRKIDLVYPPKDYAQYKPDPDLSHKMGFKKIGLVVADERSGDKKFLGEVRNGFYMHTADVVTEASVQAWVEKAFTQELERSGFSVVKTSEAQSILKVAIDEVHCNAYWGYSANVNLRLNFTKGPKVGQVSKIESFGSDGMNWAATDGGYQESLSKALADAYYQAGLGFMKPALLP
jgi:hypothetical protein